MSETFSGNVNVTNSSAQVTVTVSGNSANITAGGNGQDGDLVLKDTAGNTRIELDGQSGRVRIKATDGTVIASIDANGNIYLGGAGVDGDLVLRNVDGKDRIHLDAGGGNAWFGGNGADGDVVLFPQGATNINDLNQASIHLNGENGDIILKNADCAEDFDVEAAVMADAGPGTVMIIDESGKLRPGAKAYDKRVAGVVSGGGKYKPGIVLDKQHDALNRRPLALIGKVYCKVDAHYGAIEVGDLLTTSPTVGYAMKAINSKEAFGTVIGKALEPMQSGRGMVPVLVALQ